MTNFPTGCLVCLVLGSFGGVFLARDFFFWGGDLVFAQALILKNFHSS